MSGASSGVLGEPDGRGISPSQFIHAVRYAALSRHVCFMVNRGRHTALRQAPFRCSVDGPLRGVPTMATWTTEERLTFDSAFALKKVSIPGFRKASKEAHRIAIAKAILDHL